MKNLVIALIIMSFIGCMNNVDNEIQNKKTIYYVEVKYVDNTKDTLVEKSCYYPDFHLQTQENSKGGSYLCDDWDRIACDVRTFKIIKSEIEIQ